MHNRILLAVVLFAAGLNPWWSAHALSPDDLLEPELAFAATAQIQGERLQIRYQVADGYFLYRERFKFASENAAVELGPGKFPKGTVKDDEWFGKVETYRHQLDIELPVLSPGTSNEFVLLATSQGCADIGVCYPPHTQKLVVSIPSAPSASQGGGLAQPKNPPTLTAHTQLAMNASGTGQVSDNGALTQVVSQLPLGTSNQEEVLDPDVVFLPSVNSEGSEVQVSWAILDGYYLYKDRMQFSLEQAGDRQLGKPQFSKAKLKNDPFFGETETYTEHAQVTIPVYGTAKTALIQIKYQGCAEAQGICYPPITKSFPINFTTAGGTPPAGDTLIQAASTSTTGTEPIAEQDKIAATLASGSFWFTIAIFFGAGLLLTFTPCVLPMVPILSSIIVGQGEHVSTAKAFWLSLVYVLAMALTYTLAGVVVGLSGENVQAILQNPWVLGTFAGIFVLLSLSMFGFYELQMPASIQSRLSSLSSGQKGGTFAGVAIMGLLSALIVGPCVTAPLIGALIYIADTGDAVLGGFALFALSMGMGVPLIIFGTAAGKLLPRAGTWMESVKAVFGVILLGVAIWLLERVLPLAVTMALVALLLVISAIYMGALEPIKENAGGWPKLWKGLGLAMGIYGITMMVGAAAGGTSLLYPLRGLVAGNAMSNGATAQQKLSFELVKGIDGLNDALVQARAEQRPVMLDFYADWCVSCKEMEAFTFSDKAVQMALANTKLLKTDVTDNDELDKALLKQYGLFGPPAILFFGPDGVERRNYRTVGYVKAAAFEEWVTMAVN